MIDGFLSHLKRKNVSDRTRESYAQAVQVFLDWASGKGIPTLTAQDISEYQSYLSGVYRSKLGKSISLVTASRMLSILRVFYDYLQAERIVFRNPARQVALPKTPKRVRKNLIGTNDVERMLAAGNEITLRDTAVVYFLAATGIRATACADLTVSDIDFERREGVIRHGKGDKSRIVFFTSGCATVLADYLAHARPSIALPESDRLFLSDSGKPLNRSSVNYIVKRVAKRAGLKQNVHPHLFRHWLCTTLLEQGVNMRIVSEIAGHSRLSTTSKYTHVSVELMRQTISRYHPKGNG